MKKLFYIFLFIIISSVPFRAQEKTEQKKDTQEKSVQTDDKKSVTDEPAGQQQQPTGKLKGFKHKFIDENGDGVDDNMPGRRARMRAGMEKGKGKGMDNFVDKDGDGINDNRAQGMGWQGKGRKGGLGRHGGGK
ncbi:MAG: hypothetical protein HF309_17595 [Ignavibacteria bacterium]|jgi:hypothetical protein|nr:hypothetical protein [Ignavibacteria bacterium]HEX2961485.1 hypothetical protein [Ignavibacteriales bacterium]